MGASGFPALSLAYFNKNFLQSVDNLSGGLGFGLGLTTETFLRSIELFGLNVPSLGCVSNKSEVDSLTNIEFYPCKFSWEPKGD